MHAIAPRVDFRRFDPLVEIEAVAERPPRKGSESLGDGRFHFARNRTVQSSPVVSSRRGLTALFITPHPQVDHAVRGVGFCE